MEKYRTDQYGSLYVYDENAKAYIFIAKLNGRTKAEAVADIEAMDDDA